MHFAAEFRYKKGRKVSSKRMLCLGDTASWGLSSSSTLPPFSTRRLDQLTVLIGSLVASLVQTYQASAHFQFAVVAGVLVAVGLSPRQAKDASRIDPWHTGTDGPRASIVD